MSTSYVSTKSWEESNVEAEAIVQVEEGDEEEVQGEDDGEWRMCVCSAQEAVILATQRKEFWRRSSK